MTDLPTQSSSLPGTLTASVIRKFNNVSATTEPPPPSHIPVEIVSEEEMALIEAAMAYATRSSLSSAPASCSASFLSSSSQLQRNARSIGFITNLAKRSLSSCTEGAGSGGDIEDSCGGGDDGALSRSPWTRKKLVDSLFYQFRRKKGLYVTDITSTEWCEKQMEYSLLLGRPAVTKGMKAGIVRHAELEAEIVNRVKVRVESVEDFWALKFLNFIVGTNQLLLDGLTRELPIIGLVEGVWMVGVIDELRMPETNGERNPIFVDVKTRVQATLPTEPQQRNGRLQLMCYKYLWDQLVFDNFSSRLFFDFFSLNPNYILSEEVRELTMQSGICVQNLYELMTYFRNASSMLTPAHERLRLRYELQEDNSLIAENEFQYDFDWVTSQIKTCLQLWLGKRDASYTPEKERWKCRFCQYSSVCPVNTSIDDK